MPRGAEYVDGPPASDNAIEAGDNKIAGAPQDGQVDQSIYKQMPLELVLIINRTVQLHPSIALGKPPRYRLARMR